MKRILSLIFVLIFIPFNALAAGTVVETLFHSSKTDGIGASITVKLVVTHHTDASLSDYTLTTDVRGYYLYSVEYLYGATAPTDNSDLYIEDPNNVDLLGGAGANQIDNATNNLFQPSFFAMIMEQPRIDVDNNAVNSATYTLYITFAK